MAFPVLGASQQWNAPVLAFWVWVASFSGLFSRFIHSQQSVNGCVVPFYRQMVSYPLLSGWSLGCLFFGLFLTGVHSPIPRPDAHHVVSVQHGACAMVATCLLSRVRVPWSKGDLGLSIHLQNRFSISGFLEVLCGLISPSIPCPHKPPHLTFETGSHSAFLGDLELSEI